MFVHSTTAILQFALATQQTKLVSHFYSKYSEGWASSWELPADCVATRALLRSFAAVLEQEGDKSQSVKAQVQFFNTYKSDSGTYTAEVEKMMTSAVLSAINSPLDAFADRVALLEVRRNGISDVYNCDSEQ